MGPLSINWTLAVLGLMDIDDSPGDIHARGPIMAIWKRMPDHCWPPICTVGRAHAEGPITGRR